MNIHDFWLTEEEIPKDLTTGVVFQLLAMRQQSYTGFARLEEEQGFLSPQTSLATRKGQEMVRILLLRGIEEFLEAIHSDCREHRLEELIDAINYWWSLAIIDSTVDRTPLAIQLQRGLTEDRHTQPEGWELMNDLQNLLISMHPLFEKLRNRAWQNTAQSTYFDGVPELASFLRFTAAVVVSYFEDWREFYRYYVAKDRVLRFRLRSKY